VRRGERVRQAALCALLAALILGAAPRFTLSSGDFTDQATLESAFAYDKDGCGGRNRRPSLAWSGAPSGTRSFVLVMSDPDAPAGTFYHWIRVDIPKTRTQLPPRDRGGAVNLGIDTRNSFGTVGYAGPCPPPHEAPHRYVFTLYALSVERLAGIGPDSEPQAVLSRLRGHIVGEARLIGRYGRE
jgi:Raf kinase inhibitor-like YbhB/YbcL family protein